MSFDDSRLRSRVAWLNNAGGFENSINYSRIAEAAEGLPTKQVMDMLRYLEQNRDKVREPTRWLCSSLDKAREASVGLAEDVDRQLRKRVRWLNNDGGFDNRIVYSKLAEAASSLDNPKKVMEVLQFLEESWQWVEDPTAWVCAALRKAAAEQSQSDKPPTVVWADDAGTHRRYDSGQAVLRSRQYDSGKGKASYDDFYDKLWRRILWLNSKGGFDNAIQYPKVAEAVEGVHHPIVFDLLTRLENEWQKVPNCTAWLCRELRKAAQNGADVDGHNDAKDEKVRRRVRWLNNEGGFENVIRYDKIMEASDGMSVSNVLDVLKSLEEHWPSVKDPNAWIAAALRRAQPTEALDPDLDRRLRSRIRWLNESGGFGNTIIYSKIAKVAVGAPSDRVFEALRYLEEKGSDCVEDPTAWVCAGIQKAKKSEISHWTQRADSAVAHASVRASAEAKRRQYQSFNFEQDKEESQASIGVLKWVKKAQVKELNKEENEEDKENSINEAVEASIENVQ